MLPAERASRFELRKRVSADSARRAHATTVLHASRSFGGTEPSGADLPSVQPTRSAHLSLGVDSDGEAGRIFIALSDEGEAFMPMQETLFATRFGQLRDRLGINWLIIHERPMPART